MNDSVKSSLQKWIISHPPVIQFTIENYYIKVKVDGEMEEQRLNYVESASPSICPWTSYGYSKEICYWVFHGI